MPVKGVNFFEQHVEKIVLAVAAAGAVYMGYVAMQPIIIDGTNVDANEVEPTIAAKLETMKQRATQIANNPPKKPPLDYPERFKQSVESEPIDDPQAGVRIVQAPVADFGPTNLQLGKVIQHPGTSGDQLTIAPDPVAPENVTVDLWEGLVGAAQTSAGAPVASGTVTAGPAPQPGVASIQTHDQSAALIQGFVPTGQMLYQMDAIVAGDPRDNQRGNIPPAYRDAEIYRVRVQRRERTATGWSDYKEVQPTKAITPPAPTLDWPSLDSLDVVSALKSMGDAANFKKIVIPDFYPDASGNAVAPTVLKNPVPKDISKQIDDLRQKLLKVQAPISSSAGGTLTQAAAPANPAAGAASNGPSWPADPAAIHASEVVPFAFWDETVEPNHTYEYQVEVDFVNPLYQWSNGLKIPGVAKEPVLTTGWTNIPTPITVNSDLAFFISGSGFAPAGAVTSPEVSTWVFKKDNGKWYRNQFTTHMGAPINGTIDLVDRPGVPKIEVDTGFSVVDIADDGKNVHVVLQGPDGSLETRDSSADRADPNYTSLFNRAVVPVVATSTAPANGSPANGSLTLSSRGGSLTLGSGGGSLTQSHQTTPRPVTTRSSTH